MSGSAKHPIARFLRGLENAFLTATVTGVLAATWICLLAMLAFIWIMCVLWLIGYKMGTATAKATFSLLAISVATEERLHRTLGRRAPPPERDRSS